MIKRIAGIPTIDYDWGNGSVETATEEHAGRQVISFSCSVRLNKYVGQGPCSCCVAENDQDQQTFEKFNGYLASILPQCNSSADWNRLVHLPYARELEHLVITSVSFQAQFVDCGTYIHEQRDSPPFTFQPDCVLYKNSLWSLDGMDLSLPDCTAYIDGLLIREQRRFEYVKRVGQGLVAPRERIPEDVSQEISNYSANPVIVRNRTRFARHCVTGRESP